MSTKAGQLQLQLQYRIWNNSFRAVKNSTKPVTLQNLPVKLPNCLSAKLASVCRIGSLTLARINY